MNASTRFSNAASSISTKSAKRSGFLIGRARSSLAGDFFLWVERFLWVLDLAMDATGARALVAAAKRMSLVVAAMQRIIYLPAWDESRYQGLTQYNFLAY